MTRTIVFDADDTLWDEQSMLQRFEKAIEAVLTEKTGSSSGFTERFIALENENIPKLGYGFSSYIFSVGEAIAANPLWYAHKDSLLKEVRAVIDAFHFEGPTLVPGARETLETLSAEHKYSLVLLTRGVDFEQRFKLVRTGIEEYFSKIRVVQSKDVAIYRETAALVGDPDGDDLCMVGNSIRSDVNPAIEAGWRAIHVPPPTEWAHDHDEATQSERVHRVRHLGEVVDLVNSPGFWLH